MDDESPEGEGSRAYYSSALHPKHSQQPTARRRHSGSVNEGSSSGSNFSSRHGRSRTDSNGGGSKHSRHHPLKPVQNGFSGSAGVTRPYLASTIKQITGDLLGDDDDDPGSEMASRKEKEESIVIVHQVCHLTSKSNSSLTILFAAHA